MKTKLNPDLNHRVLWNTELKGIPKGPLTHFNQWARVNIQYGDLVTKETSLLWRAVGSVSSYLHASAKQMSIILQLGAPGRHLQKERSSEKNYNYQQQRRLGFCYLMAHPQSYQNQGVKWFAWKGSVKEEQRGIKKKMKLRVYNTPLPHIQSRRYYLVGNHILRKTEQSFNVYSYYFARC